MPINKSRKQTVSYQFHGGSARKKRWKKGRNENFAKCQQSIGDRYCSTLEAKGEISVIFHL